MSFLERAIRRGIRKGIGDSVAMAIPVIAAGAALTFIIHKRVKKGKVSVSYIPQLPEVKELSTENIEEKNPIVIMTRYSDAEIEELFSLLPEIGWIGIKNF